MLMLIPTPNSISLQLLPGGESQRTAAQGNHSIVLTSSSPRSEKKCTHELFGDFCSISAMLCSRLWDPLGTLVGLGWFHRAEDIKGNSGRTEESPSCPPTCLFLTWRQSAGAAPNRPWGGDRERGRRQCEHRLTSLTGHTQFFQPIICINIFHWTMTSYAAQSRDWVRNASVKHCFFQGTDTLN